MSRGSAARLFVAVDPPGEVARRLAGWARSAVGVGDGPPRKGASPRVLDPDSLHVTLCFLGNRPVGEIELLAGRLGACDGPIGELAAGAPLWLPESDPRALAIELQDGQGRLAEIQRAVVTAVGEVSGSRSDGAAHGLVGGGSGRGFRPHVTVARLRRGSAPRMRVLPPTPSLSFVPEELVLYRSWLSPEGASYEAVASCPIRPGLQQ